MTLDNTELEVRGLGADQPGESLQRLVESRGVLEPT